MPAPFSSTCTASTSVTLDERERAPSRSAKIAVRVSPGKTHVAGDCDALRVERESGTRGRARTFDLMIKSHLLYQLSYAGTRARAGIFAHRHTTAKVVSAEGIEPSTYWLKASCSTD